MSREMPLWRWGDLIERRVWRPEAEPRLQQLDLFSDTRRTVWHNQAYEALRCLDLTGTMVLYGRIIEAHLDDRELRDERELVATWQERLTRYRESDRDGEQIHELYALLDDRLPSPLGIALLEFMKAELATLAAPELLFIPPRFHVGLLCYELENYADADVWFGRAVEAGIRPPGRFLAYRGDALFRLGAGDPSRELYREAFLRDPLGVDLSHLADRAIRELISYGESEADEPDEVVPWLPAWGWLRSVFFLDLNDLHASEGGFLAALAKAEAEENLTAPQLWFEYLRYAEFLRGVKRNDRELVRARRRLRELNGELFGRYMKKIGGDKSWTNPR